MAGVLAAAFLAAAVLSPGIPPAPDSSAATVSTWVMSHATQLRLAALLTPFTLFFGVFFLAGLPSLLQQAGRSSVLPLAAVLAGFATLLLPMVGAIAEAAVVYNSTSLHSVTLTRFAFDTLSISGVLPFIPAVAMTGAASWQGWLTGTIPRPLIWLGWVYVPIGILGSVSAVSDNRIWFLASAAALALLGLWILVVSYVMWRK
jgi:hypothetical protein